MGLSWAMTPIGNIIIANYTYNSFVTALREHLKLENEVNMSSNPAGGTHFLSDGNYHQQYGMNPKFVQKYKSSTQSASNNTSPSFTDSFPESRRKRVCHRCKQKWSPRHRRERGSIRKYVRDRLKNGDAAVHIVSDLVLRMEGDQQVGSDSSEIDEEDYNHRSVHFSGAQDELAVFDEKLGTGETFRTQVVEHSDKEWFASNLYAALSADNTPIPNPSDFVSGGDQ